MAFNQTEAICKLLQQRVVACAENSITVQDLLRRCENMAYLFKDSKVSHIDTGFAERRLESHNINRIPRASGS